MSKIGSREARVKEVKLMMYEIACGSRIYISNDLKVIVPKERLDELMKSLIDEGMSYEELSDELDKN